LDVNFSEFLSAPPKQEVSYVRSNSLNLRNGAENSYIGCIEKSNHKQKQVGLDKTCNEDLEEVKTPA
jgi:hypothetical protein